MHQARVGLQGQARLIVDIDSYDEAKTRAALEKAGFGGGKRLQ